MCEAYKDITPVDLRANLIEFLREITPVAEEEGARLAIHADDPAFPLFGLPRVMSTAADVRAMFEAAPSQACGLTLCTGSFGSNPKNDLVAMAEEFAPRIHFVHLRNTTHEADGSFYEAAHLDGDTDLIGVAAAIMREEERRTAEGRPDAQIPMRPDHGHLLLDDIGKKVNPGYSCIGRLKGLAELRGVTRTIEAFRAGRIH
jgi:mannonate dehydratase